MKKIPSLWVCSVLLGLTLTVYSAPSDDLLGYWTLDNTTADSAPSGSVSDTGAWVGTAAYGSGAPFGSGGVFDGSSYISIPTSADLAHPGGSITISAWFKVAAFNKGWQAVISKGEGSNYRIARRSSTNELAYAGGASDIYGGSVNDGAWHSVVAVSEAGDGTTLYLDGIAVATGNAPSLADSGLALFIGNNPGSTARQWNGEIDDVAIFGEALNEFQAKAINALGTTYGYPMSDVVALFDLHAAGSGALVIGGETWNYEAADTNSGTFVLLGTNGSGVDLSMGPEIVSFVNAPSVIDSGQSATLSWVVTPPFTGLVIDNGVGNVLPMTNGSGAGSVSVMPTESTAYTLTATDAAGVSQRIATVYVDFDPTALRVNEFVADNVAEGLLDEDVESSDWIEIYNPGASAVSLSGYYLTDSAALLNKWAFPAETLAAGDYMVVFASSKSRAVAGSELHTNFRLSAGGEYLALTKDDGAGGFTVVSEFAPAFPEQEPGFSYGVGSDGLTLGYLQNPTPNSVNGTAADGFVADTSFDVDRGVFTAAFSLNITTLTPGATIRYTTDGSEPTESTGNVYSGALTISSTTTLRAAAFKEGFFPTNVDTHTYLFLNDVRTQFADETPPPGWPANQTVKNHSMNYGMDPDITSRYTAQEMIDALAAIPSISVTTAQDNLTNANTGIYVNPGSHGKTWERPASLEIINPDGVTQNLQIDCGLRIRGGASRNVSNPKHAFRLFFRGEYGAGKLNYPLFGADGAESFDKVDLRTAQNYSWSFKASGESGQNTFLREVLGRDLQAEMGQPHTRSRYYHLYLNGVYWGLYMTQERAEANFGASYLGGSAAEFDTIKSAGSSGGYNTEATDGSTAPGSDWETAWQMIQDQKAAPTTARFMQMQGLNPDGSVNLTLPRYMDVNNLVDFMLCTGYVGNFDGPLSDFVGASNNWYGVRNAVRDDRGFVFFVHDSEHSLGAGGKWNGANDRMNTANGAASRALYTKSNPQFFHMDLGDSTEEYRTRFGDRAHAALFNGGILTPSKVLATMEPRRSVVEDVIIAESARWGDSKITDPRDREDWLAAVSSLTTLINGRSSVFLGHLRTAGLYPDLDAPAYSQHGGVISFGGSISATVPTGGTHLYYKIGSGDANADDWADDLDPRLIGGAPAPDASVIAISGGGASVSLPIPDVITTPVWIKSRTYNSATMEWSALNQAFFSTAAAARPTEIVISEVHYHPTDPTLAELAVDPTFDQDDFEFVEVMNIGTTTVDLGGAAFVLIPIGDHLEGVEFTFPLGTLIGAGERLVIVANSAAFAARYPGVAIAGDYAGRLDNTGEWITLVDKEEGVIDSFRYNDLAPWPTAADGTGPSLVRVTPEGDLDPALGSNWTISFVAGGSPGVMDGTPFTGDPFADDDKDGMIAILEYAQGLSDTVPSQEFFPVCDRADVEGVEYFTIRVRIDPEAIDVVPFFEVSENLINWTDTTGTGILTLVETVTDPDGVPRRVYRLTEPLNSEERFFIRFGVHF